MKQRRIISKIVPVHKKGNKPMIENYRPVSNLCSVSKIFEKLILKRIDELEIISGVSLAGKTATWVSKFREDAPGVG